ncbi:MAG: ATP-binding protein [Bacteroidales bacterium]|jgi:hypothetical protein|nr:ATP-binding protein [Bacteroidales bacterium]
MPTQKKSPFIYGSTVSVNSFTDREEDSKKLFNNLVLGINSILVSPRRWGKSSLVEKVINDINRERKDIKTVLIDMFTVSSEEEFLELFTREVIKASATKWEEWVNNGTTFFKKLIPTINIGLNPATDFSVSFNREELIKHKDEILNLPEIISKKKGVRFVIALDEFQNIAMFTDYQNLEKRMRAIWQRQKSVSYCLFGSKRHMMTDIFDNSSKPFYRFGDIIWLQKIERNKWVDFIVSGFQTTGKRITDDEAEYIARLMKDHSWYVQQLSHYTWSKVRTVATKKHIKSALQEVIYANTPLYQREIEVISSTQLNLLKAVARNEQKLTSAQIMQEYKLGTPRNVLKNKKILINNDIIDGPKGKLEFLDPVFELWFKKVFFGEDYMAII